MATNVLALHRVSPRCFDLAGLRPASVRDQLVRSTIIVDALVSGSLIGPDRSLLADRSLLVYGAGAAGMNAAMRAASHGVNVTVVELDRIQFGAIANCQIRRIDPTEYDWPYEHWKVGKFPIVGSCPLRQPKPMSGALLAAIWRTSWKAFIRTRNGMAPFGSVDLLYELDATTLRISHGPEGQLEVFGRWHPDGAPKYRVFGALLSCVGIGQERVTVPVDKCASSYIGPAFWSGVDNLWPGAALPGNISKVVISGGGDGAMQDIQRVATSWFGRELYQRLEDLVKTFPGAVPDEQILRKLISAEETGRRAYCWAAGDRELGVAKGRWHVSMKALVARFVRNWTQAEAEVVALRLFRKELLDGHLTITWIMAEPTPGCAYALNRFLVLLLIELSKRLRLKPRPFSVRTSSIIDTIGSLDGHQCTGIHSCIGKSHWVRLKSADPKLRRQSRVNNVNLIIIRHGMESRTPLLSSRPPVPDQILPFGLR